jgi:hypothetical protein
MRESAAKLPANTEIGEAAPIRGQWPSSQSLRQELDHLLDNLPRSSGDVSPRRELFDMEPFRQREPAWAKR